MGRPKLISRTNKRRIACRNPKCGKRFTPLRNQRYCCEQCKIEGRLAIINKEQKICANPNCRKPFTANNGKQKYCCRDCSSYGISNKGMNEKIDDVVRARLETAFLLGCTDEEACFAAGIYRAVLIRYKKNHPEWAEYVKQLKISPVFEARRALINSFGKEPKLALKFLERKMRKEFAPPHSGMHAEISDKDGKLVSIEVVTNDNSDE